ncbi:replication initiation protein [Solirubrum puertoriconensis]|uniref:Replication protein RepB n=1 Tax=Solirubrum puertoriconensis TaxID=1751427 RepID=A0A9X0HNE5_SOLP1|nr:replication initiation protein [Solirubrum puertoriconensis]KUG09220.1 replication protein RepB [Solirubrum puertoriconensis]
MKPVEIRHHNAITTARYEYSELQMDLFFYLLSQLRKDDTTGVYDISVKELSRTTGKKYDYLYLRKATEAMGGRMFEVENDQVYEQIWMFQRVRYIKGTGSIQFELTNAIRPYLFDLRDNFTSFQLYAALRLTSKYAKRIYSLCSQWKDLGETKRFELDDFRRMLYLLDDKGNEKFRQIGQLKQFVLDEAVKQINEHTDLRIDYQLEKQGRAFKSIVFKITRQTVGVVLPELAPVKQLSLELPDHRTQNAGRILDELRIVDPQLRARILQDAEHVRAVNQFAHDMKTDKIKATRNPAGLLLTILGINTKAASS